MFFAILPAPPVPRERFHQVPRLLDLAGADLTNQAK
jgi:hypothetical protein